MDINVKDAFIKCEDSVYFAYLDGRCILFFSKVSTVQKRFIFPDAQPDSCLSVVPADSLSDQK